VWAGNEATCTLAKDESPLSRRACMRSSQQRPVVASRPQWAVHSGAPEANRTYPHGATKAEGKWIAGLNAAEKERATGSSPPSAAARRRVPAVPYSTEYQGGSPLRAQMPPLRQSPR
jgi:hypothetical protein